MKSWTYNTCEYQNLSRFEILNKMNELAEENWEIIQIDKSYDPFDKIEYVTFYIKREKLSQK